MKVSEIAEQLAKNPNTVFRMKGGRRWADNTKGRIIEVTSETWQGRANKTRVCYKVEVIERDYDKNDKFAYTIKKAYDTILPQHIYNVWSDTRTLEEECVSYGEASRKSAERRAQNNERTNVLTEFIIEQARAHHKGYMSVYEWKLKEMGLDFLEALAKALGYDERAKELACDGYHNDGLDTNSIGDDSVMVGGN